MGANSKGDSWQRYFSVEIADPAIHARMVETLTRLTSQPRPLALIQKAYDQALANRHDDRRLFSEIAVDLQNPQASGEARAWMRAVSSALSARQELELEATIAGKSSELAPLTAEGYRIPIRLGYVNEHNVASNVITLAPGQAGRLQYAGTDGTFHDFTLERMLSHEIGHIPQGRNLRKLRDEMRSKRKECFGNMEHLLGEAPLPKLPEGIEDLSKQALQAAQCMDDARAKEMEARITIYEQPNVVFENEMMSHIDPLSPPRGDYLRTRLKPSQPGSTAQR